MAKKKAAKTKTKKKAAKVKRAKHRDWKLLVERFGKQKGKRKRFKCGSPGSAQVARCRLLDRFPKLTVTTKGSVLVLEK